MAVFISARPRRVVYKVVSLDGKSGKWLQGSTYPNYQEAELAGVLLVRGKAAIEAQVLELTAGGGRIVAKVGKDADGKVAVKKF